MQQQSLRTDDWEAGIIKKYSDMVYRLAFSHTRNKSDADDIYQEVFLRLIRKQPQFESEQHKKAWLIRVTINCCKKHWASSWRKRIILFEEPVAYEIKNEIDLYEELQELPQKYRMVIHLYYYENFSVEEISHILNQKPSTIRTQLTRARYKLKEILKEDFDV